MELRHYWNIIRNRVLIVLGLPLLVAALTLALAAVLPQHYVVKTSLLITQRPISTPGTPVSLPDQNNWYSWAASEYANDDLLQIVLTERFAQDVSDWIAGQHRITIDPQQISKGIKSERKHRTVYLTVSGDTPERTLWIAQGAAAMLKDKGLGYWQRENSGTQLDVSVLDLPQKAKPAKGLLATLLDVILRSLLAVLLGIGIAFLLHYIDQTVRRPADVEALGFEVVGAIPTESRRKH